MHIVVYLMKNFIKHFHCMLHHASKFHDNWTTAAWTMAVIIYINEVHLKNHAIFPRVRNFVASFLLCSAGLWYIDLLINWKYFAVLVNDTLKAILNTNHTFIIERNEMTWYRIYFIIYVFHSCQCYFPILKLLQ